MTRVPRTALLLAAALVAMARSASAQDVPSPIRDVTTTQAVHVFAGYLVPSRGVQITDSTEVNFGPKPAPMLGVSYELRATGGLNLQLAVGFSPSERRLFTPEYVDDSTRVEAVDTGVDVPSGIVTTDVALLFHLTGPRTWHSLAPYVLLGGGIVADVRGTFQEEADLDLSGTQLYRFGPTFALRTGLGTDWFVSDNLSIRGELQGRLWRTSPPDAFVVPVRERSEWNQVGAVTVGAAFHF
ncbi:MAG TPA: hypothetical protein VF665_02900 [Longimicrobium sp.]|jgi:opacity protein-like surface antigen|uniref:hypothetical protein n=1 Tax=Longimicrobium sp. TaxID=2029185 RepID=UPI002ED7C22F